MTQASRHSVPRDGDIISPSGCVKLQGRRGVIIRPPGVGACTWCGCAVTEPRRRTWCSQRCVDFYKATQPDHQRRLVQERDQGRCQSCGIDCARRRWALRRWRLLLHRRGLAGEALRLHMAESLSTRGLPTSTRQLESWMGRRRLWDVDHVVPIWEGGHPYDLRNLRTLCPWCHARETSEGAARRAERRRGVEDQGPQIALFGDECPC